VLSAVDAAIAALDDLVPTREALPKAARNDPGAAPRLDLAAAALALALARDRARLAARPRRKVPLEQLCRVAGTPHR
jgi:hypothetical protein